MKSLSKYTSCINSVWIYLCIHILFDVGQLLELFVKRLKLPERKKINKNKAKLLYAVYKQSKIWINGATYLSVSCLSGCCWITLANASYSGKNTYIYIYNTPRML